MHKPLFFSFIITSCTFLHMSAADDNKSMTQRDTQLLRQAGMKVMVKDPHVYTRECDAQASKKRQARVDDTKTRLQKALERRRAAQNGNN